MVFVPVTVWSSVSRSLQPACPEENWSVFALFSIHPSAGPRSSSLHLVPELLLQSGALFSHRPPLAFLLLRRQSALVTPPHLQLICTAAQAPCSLRSQYRRLPCPAYRPLSLSSGSSPQPPPLGYFLSSLHSASLSFAFRPFRLERNLCGFSVPLHATSSLLSLTAEFLRVPHSIVLVSSPPVNDSAHCDLLSARIAALF